MFRQVILATFLFLGTMAALPQRGAAQVVGQVAAVVPGAELRTAAGTVRLVKGAQLSMGDVVTTDATGQAELLFADGTKIAVGRGSRLVVEEILMRQNGKAQRFAVSAVGGTFRFITGKSAKSAYDISTPTGTLGLRGTTFDFAVTPQRGTNVVLFRGRVLLCAQGGNCADVRGRCTVAVATPQGRAGGADDPEKVAIVDENFPFVIDQSVLTRSFRAPTGACAELVREVKQVRRARAAAIAPPCPVRPWHSAAQRPGPRHARPRTGRSAHAGTRPPA